MRRRGIGRAGRPGLIGTAARTAVIAGTATAVSGKVAASQAAASQSQAGPAPAPPPAPPPAAAPPAPPPPAAAPPPPSPASAPAPVITDEVFDQLKMLGELRDAGILTEDEFAAKKALLIGS
jgi:hypothetical protein